MHFARYNAPKYLDAGHEINLKDEGNQSGTNYKS